MSIGCVFCLYLSLWTIGRITIIMKRVMALCLVAYLCACVPVAVRSVWNYIIHNVILTGG